MIVEFRNEAAFDVKMGSPLRVTRYCLSLGRYDFAFAWSPASLKGNKLLLGSKNWCLDYLVGLDETAHHDQVGQVLTR